MDDRRKTIPPIISPIVDEQRGNDEQIVMPTHSGYYAVQQRRAIAATRQCTEAACATMLLASVGRWSDPVRNLPASYVDEQRSDVRTRLLATGFG
jgi:hypothetical protein